jgi:uncharacterized protein YggE
MKEKFKNLPTLFTQAVFITAAVVLAIVAVSRFVSPIPISISQTTTQKESAFIATGESTISTQPDKAEITLGISRRDSDIKRAQSQANTTINTITQKLTELGIKREDIQTLNYSIYPNYDYQNSAQNIVGYSIDVSLKINLTNFELLNQVVDAATAAGANQIGGIQFTLSKEKEQDVRKQAREQAIEDAKKNAQELSRLSGVKLGKVINVSEGGSDSSPIPLYAKDMAQGGGGAAGAPTNVEPGKTSYNYSVTLSYETL